MAALSASAFAVILAGGSGTRFWPASRRSLPKQYLPIGGPRPLIAETLARLEGLVPPERTLVVSAAEQAEALGRALPSLPRENLLHEPCARNTAASVAWAALEIRRRSSDSVQVVLPADHVIRPAERLRASLRAGLEEAAASGALVTFGIRPTRPATGFGYIELGAALAPRDGQAVHRVLRFVEKPERERAQQFLASGRFLWNAGIFAWRTDSILAALARHAPSTLEGLSAALGGGDFAARFEALPSVSIDVAVLEREGDVRTLPIDYFWSDVGAWNSLADVVEPDAAGNRRSGGAELSVLDASNNIVHGDAGALVALIGVENLVVVRAGDAVLVATRERADEVRALVERLAREKPRFV
ncbi:MAG: mannose-1-phosphate guanylyltransferase [Planctomycetes bacterium]|nr:mannose-1-phosphate guanylyltransferase [Planctomycetota bacterium]